MDKIDTQNLPDLSKAEAGLEDLVLGSEIDFSRPLNEYPTAANIAAHLLSAGSETHHIYTDDLREHKEVIQDNMESYLAKSNHYSSSQLKAAFKSPFHLYYEKISGWKEELEQFRNRPYFELGSFLHECILEPTKFSRVIVEPKNNLASTKGVEDAIEFWKDQIIRLHEDGKERIQRAEMATRTFGHDMDKLQGKKAFMENLRNRSELRSVREDHFQIIDIVHRNFKAYAGGILPRILKHSKREISMYSKDEATGLNVRIRPDAIQFKENIGADTIISVKSTSKPDLQAFIRDMASRDYGLSEGMYQEVATKATGRDFNCTITIMVQTCAPYAIAALVWGGEDIEVGKYKYRQALNIAKECEDKGKYPGYEAFAESGNFGLIDFSLPNWYKQELSPVNIE